MSERGFTLIEAWLVLAVMSALLVVSQLAIIQPFEHFVEAQTVAQLKYDFTLAQAMAMQHNEKVTIRLRTSNTYEITNGRRNVERTIASGVIEHSTGSGREFYYTERGTPGVVGKFIYDGVRDVYDVKIHFGRGRIEIVPQ